jgi:hypothetical protein
LYPNIIPFVLFIGGGSHLIDKLVTLSNSTFKFNGLESGAIKTKKNNEQIK